MITVHCRHSHIIVDTDTHLYTSNAYQCLQLSSTILSTFSLFRWAEFGDVSYIINFNILSLELGLQEPGAR